MRRGLSGIGSITMNTQDLLDIVRENREKHHEIFMEAVGLFREKAIRKLDSIIAELKANKTPNLYVNLPVPEEHLDDYDRAINMLLRHTEPTITLDETGYMRLVDNEWDWSDLWTANTASYVAQ